MNKQQNRKVFCQTLGLFTDRKHRFSYPFLYFNWQNLCPFIYLKRERASPYKPLWEIPSPRNEHRHLCHMVVPEIRDIMAIPGDERRVPHHTQKQRLNCYYPCSRTLTTRKSIHTLGELLMSLEEQTRQYFQVSYKQARRRVVRFTNRKSVLPGYYRYTRREHMTARGHYNSFVSLQSVHFISIAIQITSIYNLSQLDWLYCVLDTMIRMGISHNLRGALRWPYFIALFVTGEGLSPKKIISVQPRTEVTCLF